MLDSDSDSITMKIQHIVEESAMVATDATIQAATTTIQTLSQTIKQEIVEYHHLKPNSVKHKTISRNATFKTTIMPSIQGKTHSEYLQ